MNKERKIIKKAGIAAVIAAALAVFSIYGACSGGRHIPVDNGKNSSSGESFAIWALSDIQPREEEEYAYFEKSIEDVNRNIRGINLAIVGGDLIHWSKSPDVFQWYLDARGKSYIDNWYEIAGNHDQKDGENYLKYIKKPLHYSVSAGNILILLLSDENKEAETVIGERAFKWWRGMVIKNQDNIIITVTHAYLAQSGLFGAIVPSRNIRDSKRFADVLKKYRVDIWLCGHAHVPHWIHTRIKIKKSLGGTIFINVSAIRGNLFKNPESCLLFFKNRSATVLIRSRDHYDREYNECLDVSFKLSRPFRWNGAAPVMEPME